MLRRPPSSAKPPFCLFDHSIRLSGTFSPSTDGGLAMVVVLGSISIILFGLCVGPIGSWIDARVSRCAEALLARISRRSHLSLTTESHLLQAKVLVAYVASQCVIGLCALVAYANPEQVHDGWEVFDYYYFAFVTTSSVGFGDFAMGPTNKTSQGLMGLFIQATAIFVGMAFFNSFTGVGGDLASVVVERAMSYSTTCVNRCGPSVIEPPPSSTWSRDRIVPSEAKSPSPRPEQASPEPEPASPEPMQEACTASGHNVTFDKVYSINDQVKPAKEEDEQGKLANGVKWPASAKSQTSQPTVPIGATLKRAKSVKKFGARLKRAKTQRLTHIASSSRPVKVLSRCRREARCLLPWLALYFTMMVLGGLIFRSIEAEQESMQAKALRDQENVIRAIAGIVPKGVQLNASRANSPADTGPDAVRARLLEIGSMDEAAQTAATEDIVSDFKDVVEHETGCDQLSDLTSYLLSQCKAAPPSPISLNWSFNGAIFFMMTVMTTIGYGARFWPQSMQTLAPVRSWLLSLITSLPF